MLHHIFLLVLLTNGVTMAPTTFICPPNHITISSGVSGVVPAGATDSVPVVAGTNCTFYFDLPAGFALKISYKGSYNPQQGDSVLFNNEIFLKNNEIEFAVRNTIPLAIVASTSQMTFFATYSFIDMSTYTQKNFTTGHYFSTVIEKNKYYTMWASEGDHVAMSLSGRANSQFYDLQPDHVFVYQSSSCDTNYFLGRLERIYRNFLFSEGQALTFVNLYEDETSNSIVLGNDWSKVSYYDEVHAIWVDLTTPQTLNLVPSNSMHEEVIYTIICENCDQFYIAGWDFENTMGYFNVRGMTPTDDLQTAITYQSWLSPNESLPQLIPAPMATIYSNQALAKVIVSADEAWTTPYYNRNGFLGAPMVWDPMNEQSFNYTFEDGKGGRYNYRLTVDRIVIGSDDKLTITIGNGNAKPVVTKTLTSIDSRGLHYGGTGEYLTVSYEGSKDNELRIWFYDFMP